MKHMKIFALAVLSLVVLTGCAAQGDQAQGSTAASFDDAPTGTLIKRRPVKDENGNIVQTEKTMSTDPTVIGTFDTKR